MIYKNTDRPKDDTIVKEFNKIYSVFKEKKGYKGVEFLRSIDERTKYGYIIFGHWESIDDYRAANEKRPVSGDTYNQINFNAYQLIRAEGEKSDEAISHVLFFQISNPLVSEDFSKTVDSVLDNLKTKKGFLQARAYKSAQPFETEYPYVVITKFKDLESHMEAFQEEVAVSSIARNLPQSIKIIPGLYQRVR